MMIVIDEISIKSKRGFVIGDILVFVKDDSRRLSRYDLVRIIDIRDDNINYLFTIKVAHYPSGEVIDTWWNEHAFEKV